MQRFVCERQVLHNDSEKKGEFHALHMLMIVLALLMFRRLHWPSLVQWLICLLPMFPRARINSLVWPFFRHIGFHYWYICAVHRVLLRDVFCFTCLWLDVLCREGCDVHIISLTSFFPFCLVVRSCRYWRVVFTKTVATPWKSHFSESRTSCFAVITVITDILWLLVFAFFYGRWHNGIWAYPQISQEFMIRINLHIQHKSQLAEEQLYDPVWYWLLLRPPDMAATAVYQDLKSYSKCRLLCWLKWNKSSLMCL